MLIKMWVVHVPGSILFLVAVTVIHFQRVDWWFQLFFSHYFFMEMGKLSQLTFIS